MTGRPLFIWLFCLALAAAAGFTVHEFAATEGPKIFTDTQSYQDTATYSVFSRKFWFGIREPISNSRPPVYPLFIAAFKHKLNTVARRQAATSILCWSLAAFAVFSVTRRKTTGLLGALAVLILGCSPDVLGMLKVILTESLSFSLVAGAFGATLLYVNGFKQPWLWLATILWLLYALIRDSSAYFVLFIGLSTGAAAGLAFWKKTLSRRHWVSLAICAALMVGSFLVSNFTSTHGERWVFPLYNNFGKRILPHPERVAWFQAHGMPVDDAVMARAGRFAGHKMKGFNLDPQLETFRNWTSAHGKSVYTRWLLSHPAYLVAEPLRDLMPVLTSNLRPFMPGNYRPCRLWPESLTPAGVWIWGTLAAGLLIVAMWTGNTRTRRLVLTMLAMLILSFPQYLVVWHGDAMHVERHSAQALMQVKLAVVMLIAVALDDAWDLLLRGLRKR